MIQAVDLDQDGTVEVTYDGDGVPEGGEELLVTETVYDEAGRALRTTGPDGQVTEQTYDAAGRVVTSTLAGDGATGDIVTQSIYDDASRRIAAIDPLDRRTDYTFDDAGRLRAVTLPAIDTTDARRPHYEYHYDVRGNRTHGIAHAYLDEATGRVEYRTADGQNQDYRPLDAEFDAWPTDLGHVTEFAHDEQGRPTTRQLPLGTKPLGGGGFTETQVYDKTANRTVDVDGDGVNDSDPGYGQLLHEVDFEGRVTSYQYDNTPTGRGRLLSKKHFADEADFTANQPARTTSYTYDADGRLVTIASPQGTLHYAYDDLGRKTATYTGDAATSPADAITATLYTYDKLGRLIEVTASRRFGANVTSQTTKTIYDKAGLARSRAAAGQPWWGRHPRCTLARLK